jgi:glycerol uptake facilitator-like aquaporin
MINKKQITAVFAEGMGTAVLTFAVLAIARSAVGISYFVAIGVALTLALLVLIIGSISGAHVNPAVTFGLWTLRKIKSVDALLYVAAQFAGALLALFLYSYLVELKSTEMKVIEFEPRVFVAELAGTFLFTFGIAAAIYQKFEGGKLAATIGASLGVGVLVAGVVSNGALNPALALGIQSWGWAYLVGPLLGALLGMNLYALFFANDRQTLLPKRPIKKASATKKTTKKSNK